MTQPGTQGPGSLLPPPIGPAIDHPVSGTPRAASRVGDVRRMVDVSTGRRDRTPRPDAEATGQARPGESVRAPISRGDGDRGAWLTSMRIVLSAALWAGVFVLAALLLVSALR